MALTMRKEELSDVWRFDAWFAAWRNTKSAAGSVDATPVQDLQVAMIASGDWLLVIGDRLVKVASKRKPGAKDVREIAAGLHAAGQLLNEAADRYELISRGLKA